MRRQRVQPSVRPPPPSFPPQQPSPHPSHQLSPLTHPLRTHPYPRRPAQALTGCSYLGTSGPDDPGDCLALRTAFEAFNQRPSSWATGYATGTSYCTWDPTIIVCDATTRRVDQLLLDSVLDNGGTIPAALRFLRRLDTLVIANNPTLTGSIPAVMFKMANNISYLAINDNELVNGSFPVSIGGMRNLTYLCAPPPKSSPAHAQCPARRARQRLLTRHLPAETCPTTT